MTMNGSTAPPRRESLPDIVRQRAIIANPGNGEFSFVGAGGGAATAVQATGYVAYATIDRDQPLASVLASRRGQGGWVNAIVCPSGLRGGGSSCRSAIDPAGAGLALIAR